MNPNFDNANWHRHSFRVMGCHMAIWLEHADAYEAMDALNSAEDLFFAAEQRLSRFSATSELSQLNRGAGRWNAVSRTLWRTVRRAQQLAAETDGLFDPTVLPALEKAGYHRPFSQNYNGNGHVNNSDSILEATVAPPTADLRGCWQEIELNDASRCVRIPQGARIDLGGIAKGMTAQAAVDYLSHWGPCLVDAGGDLTAGDAPRHLPGWPVAIAAPSANTPDAPTDSADDAPPLLQLWLAHGTLATSGVDYRRWRSDATMGRENHHIIDPRSGAPAQCDAVTVSVLSGDAAHAEAWATAGLVADTSEAMRCFEARGIAAALVDAQNQVRQTSTLTPYVMAQGA